MGEKQTSQHLLRLHLHQVQELRKPKMASTNKTHLIIAIVAGIKCQMLLIFYLFVSTSSSSISLLCLCVSLLSSSVLRPYPFFPGFFSTPASSSLLPHIL